MHSIFDGVARSTESERDLIQSPPTTPAPAAGAGALHREIARERLRGVRRVNLLRLWGVSAFLALFLALGGMLRMPGWTGSIPFLTVYWLVAVTVFWTSRRYERVASRTTLTIALVDTPCVFFVQWAALPTSPSASGVAGFTIGVYVLFVILATLSLDRRYILLTALAGTAFEVLLQRLAGVSEGAMVSTMIVLALATVSCSYARDRLVALVERVERTTQVEAAQRRAEDRLRETTGLLGIAQTLSGVTEVEEALRRICRELARLTGAETVGAYLVDRENAALRPIAGYHVPPALRSAFQARAVPLADLACAGGLEQSRVLVCDRVPETPGFGPWPVDRFPHQSGLLVPFSVEGKVSGAFYLAWWTAQRVFDPAELALAEAVGRQVGSFIQTARLYEELEQSRRRSVQAERWRALGEMAAGVAHDFNNVLAIVLGRAELLLRTEAAAPFHAGLRVIATAAEDGARTVRRIQEFTRRTPRRPLEPMDLGAVVGDVLEMTRARWHDQAQARGVRYDVAASVEVTPPVMGDAADLREVLTNLVFNALDAMPHGGRLTLRTQADGARVRCEVTDTGVGMPPEVTARAFEPFFSTKLEKGSGLGLSIVYGVVARLGGEVTVESQPGVGSTFRLWLPVAGAAPAPPPADRPGRAAPAAAARVLVVDDEAGVRHALADILRLDGHQPLICADGAAAVRALEAGPVDLVLTDLGMPGLGGWDVARAVKQRYPETPVGLVTGWRDSLDEAQTRARGVDFLINKPFKIADVREALARYLRPAAAHDPGAHPRMR